MHEALSSRTAAALSVAALLLLTTRAHAANANLSPPCETMSGTVVALAFEGDGWDEALEHAIAEHLRAGLEPSGFHVCTATTDWGSAPVARIDLRRNAGPRVTATIEVHDGVTAKRVARDIDLSRLPEDGVALGVGVAADELLRASWVELELRDAPPPPRPPPPAVSKAVARSLRPPPTNTELAVRGSAEGYAGGLVLFGGDIALRRWVSAGVGFELAVGLREAPGRSSPHGEVSASALGAGAALLVGLARTGGARFGIELGVRAAELRLQGTARAAAAGGAGAELLFTAGVGAVLTVALSRNVALSTLAGAGYALRSVSARDFGEIAVGASGVEWFAGLGPAVMF